MRKIGLIIKREYFTRVRKKSFIIMTLLGPLLFALVMTVPILIVYFSSTESKSVLIIDESGQFEGKFTKAKSIDITFGDSNVDIKKASKKYTAVLKIPSNLDFTQPKGIELISHKNVGFDVKNRLENKLEAVIHDSLLAGKGLTRQEMKALKPSINLGTKILSETGETKESSTGAATVFGYLFGFLIYIFVFSYGGQVFKGVLEEKTSRIVEVLVSSVKPIELMMGKIIGIAAVGLTQFLLWTILTVIISASFTAAIPAFFGEKGTNAAIEANRSMSDPTGTMSNLDNQEEDESPSVSNEKDAKVMKQFASVKSAIGTVNIPLLIACFLFYFFGGYLIYASLFAAVGGAVDNETDSQQFMLPITIPMILSFIVGQGIITNPDGTLAIWLSMIPLTSPVIMMFRIPFGVPAWQIGLSMLILTITFIGITYMAGRIYRVGILMYGKKVTYKELGKWLFYKA